jgi:hypothetical protein
VVDLELPETIEHTTPHSVEPRGLTACEVNPLVHLQPSASDLAVKRRFIEVDESQYLRQELNSKKAQIQLAEQRRNEKLRQSQEAQRQEIASLQTHVSEQNTLVEARYAEQLRQSKQAFQQELLQKEQAMQREFQERNEAARQELLLGMQQKEEAMRREHELEITKAKVSRVSRLAVRTLRCPIGSERARNGCIGAEIPGAEGKARNAA